MNFYFTGRRFNPCTAHGTFRSEVIDMLNGCVMCEAPEAEVSGDQVQARLAATTEVVRVLMQLPAADRASVIVSATRLVSPSFARRGPYGLAGSVVGDRLGDLGGE